MNTKHTSVSPQVINSMFGSSSESRTTLDTLQALLESEPQEMIAPLSELFMSYAALRVKLFEDERQIEDLNQALRMLNTALTATPEYHVNHGRMLFYAANYYEIRYKNTGDRDDLDMATHFSREAVAKSRDDVNRVNWLIGLGSKLECQFQVAGDLESLDEALQVTRRALDIMLESHDEDVIRLATAYNNIGSILLKRFDYSMRVEDLREATEVLQMAACITPQDHSDHALILNNLGNAFQQQFGLTWDFSLLREAIAYARESLATTPQDNPLRATRIGNLGNKMQYQFQDTKNQEDIKEGIQLLRQATSLTLESNPELPVWLNNLSFALSSVTASEDTDILEEAISASRKAVLLTPASHPSLAMYLNNLANRLQSRYALSGDASDINEAIGVAIQAWDCMNASPFTRIRSAIQALRYLHTTKEYARAFDFAVKAIDLMPSVNGQSLDHKERQYAVSHFTGMATSACSLALQTGQGAEVALELLERGRGVIIRLFMDERSDTSQLKIAEPNLCARYLALKTSINASRYTEAMATALGVLAANEKDIREFEDCIEEIRRLPGLEGFRKAMTCDQMRACTKQGAIVVVNVTALRSDAIIVTPESIKSLNISNLTAQQAEDWLIQDLITPKEDVERGQQNKSYSQFLSWLWEGCVEKVFDELGHQAMPHADDLPRVWWIGSGLASSFPFHSAGEANPKGTKSACYRAISSYTPTIEALKYTRAYSKRSGNSDSPRNVLIVSMPETPNGPPAGELDPLNTEKEVAAIQEAFGDTATINSLVQPEGMAVLQGLYFCNIVHFACHGISHPADPSQSSLILQTPYLDSFMQSPLYLNVILNSHFRQAEIAYLSACSTARNSAKDLVDEILHLVSGFQVAGFRHTIGCLWESDDQICLDVASSFYRSIVQCGSNAYDDGFVALALHKAVMPIREIYPKRPLLWAQYVHFGA